MHPKRIYRKSATFFSRNKQELLVSQFEKNFYDIVLIYSNKQKELKELKVKIISFQQDLRNTLAQYYFEDELLEHLFNLNHFIENYLEFIQKKSVKMHNEHPFDTSASTDISIICA